MDIEATLNGCVYRQGFKIEVAAWMDMGSSEWKNTSDADKAKAYQSVKCCGWSDDGLKSFMVKRWGPRIDQEWANLTITTLQECLQKHPVEVEQVRETLKDDPIFKRFEDPRK